MDMCEGVPLLLLRLIVVGVVLMLASWFFTYIFPPLAEPSFWLGAIIFVTAIMISFLLLYSYSYLNPFRYKGEKKKKRS